jgi:hypothetical protein
MAPEGGAGALACAINGPNSCLPYRLICALGDAAVSAGQLVRGMERSLHGEVTSRAKTAKPDRPPGPGADL